MIIDTLRFQRQTIDFVNFSLTLKWLEIFFSHHRVIVCCDMKSFLIAGNIKKDHMAFET